MLDFNKLFFLGFCKGLKKNLILRAIKKWKLLSRVFSRLSYLFLLFFNQLSNSSSITMPLSCLSHIKRTREDDGTIGSRPDAPPVAVFTAFDLDRSGSMCSYNGAQHVATKELFAQQKKSAEDSDVPHYLTVTTFDNEPTVYLNNTDAKLTETPTDAQLAEWCDPRGSTKLYDTALQSVKRLQKVAREWYDAQPVSFRRLVGFDRVVRTYMLFTDGFDNSSSLDRDGSMMREAIREFRKEGGTAIFMASNQDACETGSFLGFSSDNSLTVGTTPEYASQAFRGVTEMLRARSGGNNVTVPQCLRQSSAPPSFQDQDDDDGDIVNSLLPGRHHSQPFPASLRQSNLTSFVGGSAAAAIAAAAGPPPLVRHQNMPLTTPPN